MNKKPYIIFSCLLILLAFSCTTFPKTEHKPIPEQPSIYIDARGTKSAQQLFAFFISKNPDVKYEKVIRLAEYYISESNIEGINSDVAFIQMCLETGFLRFGGLVTEEMNNFCGLGSIDKNNPGNTFETELLGVRAHIQHLHAYGTTRELKQPLIDTRYKYVNPRGKAPTIHELAGTWAADKAYGTKLESLLNQLSVF